MMLGMNAPKAVAKGEYAKAIRKAVHEAQASPAIQHRKDCEEW